MRTKNLLIKLEKLTRVLQKSHKQKNTERLIAIIARASLIVQSIWNVTPASGLSAIAAHVVAAGAATITKQKSHYRMTVIYSIATESGISCFYKRKKLSEYSISFTDETSEQSLAVAQIMMLIIIARYDFSLRTHGVNSISFTNANALAMAVNPSLIPEALSEKRQLVQLLKSRFNFSFSLCTNPEVSDPPQNGINTSTSMHRWHGLFLKNIGDFYYFSCLRHEAAKFHNRQGEQPLNEEEIIKALLTAEKANERNYFHTFLSDSESYAGNGFFRLKYFPEHSCAIILSKNLAQTEILIALFRTSEEQYYSSALNIIKKCCSREANIYPGIAEPKIKSIPTKKHQTLGKVILTLQVNMTATKIYFGYNLRVYSESDTNTPKSSHYGTWENKNPDLNTILRDLWICLRNHWLDVDGKSIEIFTNSVELRKSIYTPQTGPVSGFLWSLLNTRFPSIQIHSASFTGQIKSPSGSYLSDHNLDEFLVSLPLFYIKGIGQARMSLHAVRRYFQREMELSGKLIPHPFKKLSSIASSVLWREMSPSEIKQYWQNDYRARILINDESGWLLVLADQTSTLQLLTVFNIKLKYTRERQSIESS